MKTETAFDMIRDLGKAFRTGCTERGYEPEGGWHSDLINGIVAVIKLELTDEDVTDITEAWSLVMKDISLHVLEGARKTWAAEKAAANAEDFIADQDTVDQVKAGNTA